MPRFVTTSLLFTTITFVAAAALVARLGELAAGGRSRGSGGRI